MNEEKEEENNSITFKAKVLSENKFDNALDKALDRCIEELQSSHFDKTIITLHKEKNREAQKKDLQNYFDYSELFTHISHAIRILFAEGVNYLGKIEHEEVCKKFCQAQLLLEQLDLESIPNKCFGDLLKIDQNTASALFKIALAKSEKHEYNDSLSFFILLTFLYPENFDFWYRTGLIAQKLENYSLALHVYAAAIYSNENLIQARLFSVECYLKLGQRQEAIAEYEEAKKMSLSLNFDKKWNLFLETLTQRIKNS